VDAGFVHSAATTQQDPSAIESIGLSLLWTPVAATLVRLTYGHAFQPIQPLGKPDIQDQGFSFDVTTHPLDLFGLWR
jgi:hypothetical protein